MPTGMKEAQDEKKKGQSGNMSNVTLELKGYRTPWAGEGCGGRVKRVLGRFLSKLEISEGK